MAVSKLAWIVLVVFLVSANEGNAQEKVVIAYSGVSGFQGPLWAFNDLQLFPKYDLNPEIVLIGGGTQSMQALLSGYTHFALASATAPMSIKLQGGNVVIVGAGLNKFPYSLVARRRLIILRSWRARKLELLTSAARMNWRSFWLSANGA
jgi:ABC-type nitrate/sulfonate/bicarbonate transport system substrate-binding protein